MGDFVAKLAADMKAQKEAEKVKPAMADAQAKRSAHQPQRACPTFAPSHLDLAPPPASHRLALHLVKCGRLHQLSLQQWWGQREFAYSCINAVCCSTANDPNDRQRHRVVWMIPS